MTNGRSSFTAVKTEGKVYLSDDRPRHFYLVIICDRTCWPLTDVEKFGVYPFEKTVLL